MANKRKPEKPKKDRVRVNPPDFLTKKISEQTETLLDQMIAEFSADISEESVKKWESNFSEFGAGIAESVIKTSELGKIRAFKQAFSSVPPLDKQKKKEITTEIVEDYTKIPREYKDLVVEKALELDQAAFLDLLTAVGGGVKNFAKNRSLSIIRRTSATVGREIAINLGVTEFTWIHVSSPHPRGLHQSYHGKKFKLSDPPIIYDNVHGFPADALHCRCIAIYHTEIKK